MHEADVSCLKEGTRLQGGNRLQTDSAGGRRKVGRPPPQKKQKKSTLHTSEAP